MNKYEQLIDELHYTSGPVVKPGEFVFAVAALDHGHAFDIADSLVKAGGVVKWVYDTHPQRIERFVERFAGVKVARSLDEILLDNQVHMVCAAAIPSERCALGIRVMEAGKDYLTDKAPLLTLEQLSQARAAVARTGRKYLVHYGERLDSESGLFAGHVIERGMIGKLVQVIGFGPHRLAKKTRPEWFFQKERYGGILIDIGCHQIEQFLYYSKAAGASITHSRVANTANPDYPELEDFGEMSLVSHTGVSGYFRVDWLTPDGLNAWGDVRVFLLGTKGFIELRKGLDLATQDGRDHVLIADEDGETRLRVGGRIGLPFFGQVILDCLNRTETAMTHQHTFKVAELSILAQINAEKNSQLSFV